MTDNLQPIPRQRRARKPARGRPQGRPAPLLPARPRQPPGRHRALPRRRDRRRCGPLARASSARSAGSSRVEFADGAHRPPRPDHPRPRRTGTRASRSTASTAAWSARRFLPWFHKSSDVECFSTRTASTTAPSARTPTSTAARSRASPTRSSRRAERGRERRRRARRRAGDGRDRALGRAGRARRPSEPTRRLYDAARHLRQDVRPPLAGGDARRRGAPRPGMRPVQHGAASGGRRCPSRDRAGAVAARSPARSPRAASTMAAVSGTYNMIDPDPGAPRRRPARGSACCRRPAAGWAPRSSRSAPARATPRTCGAAPRERLGRGVDATWSNRCAAALELAEAHDVVLAFEPELANVVDSRGRGAAPARRAAFAATESRRSTRPTSSRRASSPGMREILDEAFDPARPRHRPRACQGPEPRRRRTTPPAAGGSTTTLSRPAARRRLRRPARSSTAWPRTQVPGAVAFLRARLTAP